MVGYIILFVALGLLLVALITAFICFMRVFYSPSRRELSEDEYGLPDDEIYNEFREQMVDWIKTSRKLAHEDVSIRSFDGLTLRGKYYECNPDGIVEILFHGYQGNAERDMSGGIERCFALGRNALIVDHRGSGRSDGHVITFGINERRDVHAWIDFAIKHFGKDKKIVLTGISMGAATVMMAAGDELPENVVCVLADCGYTSPREIICKVIHEMRLPEKILYPFVKLGALIFGRFHLDECAPIEALKKSKVPVIFIHGDADDFVPCEMSERLYGVCASEHKSFVAISGAAHGLSYPKDKDGYLGALRDFQEECGF